MFPFNVIDASEQEVITYRPEPLVGFALSASDIQDLVELRIIDMKLIGIHADNGALTCQWVSETKSRGLLWNTVFPVVIHDLPGVLASAYNIRAKLVPEGKCCGPWVWETCNGRKIKTPYRATRASRSPDIGQGR